MTVSLPGTVKDAVVGGSGRFLICGLRSLEKLAVFDISEGKIAGYVSLDDPQDCFAAGAEKLMVVNRQTRIVKRDALAGLKQEAAQRIPGEVPVVAVAMGAASRGPLFVACDDNARPQSQISALDPITFQPSENEITTQLDSSRGPIPSGNVNLRASGDGSVLGVWKDQAFGGIFVVSFSANHLECSNRPQAAGYVCPDDVGERIYSGSGLLNSRGEQIDEEDPAGQRGLWPFRPLEVRTSSPFRPTIERLRRRAVPRRRKSRSCRSTC